MECPVGGGAGSCWEECENGVPCFAHVRLEYRERTGMAKIKFEWESFTQARAVVPATHLYAAVPISDAPKTVTVDVGSLSSETSLPYGDALTQVVAGQAASFFIQAKDAAGNNMTGSDDVFSVEEKFP